MLLLQSSTLSSPVPIGQPGSSSFSPAHNQTCPVPSDYYVGQPAWHPTPNSPSPSPTAPLASPPAALALAPDTCAVPGLLRSVQTCHGQMPSPPMPHPIPASASSPHPEVSRWCTAFVSKLHLLQTPFCNTCHLKELSTLR